MGFLSSQDTAAKEKCLPLPAAPSGFTAVIRVDSNQRHLLQLRVVFSPLPSLSSLLSSPLLSLECFVMHGALGGALAGCLACRAPVGPTHPELFSSCTFNLIAGRLGSYVLSRWSLFAYRDTPLPWKVWLGGCRVVSCLVPLLDLLHCIYTSMYMALCGFHLLLEKRCSCS